MKFYYYYSMAQQFLEQYGIFVYFVFCAFAFLGFNVGFKVLESRVKGGQK